MFGVACAERDQSRFGAVAYSLFLGDFEPVLRRGGAREGTLNPGFDRRWVGNAAVSK